MENRINKERQAVAVINRAIKSCVHPIQLSGVMGMLAGFIALYPGSKYFEPMMDKVQFHRRLIQRVDKQNLITN